MKVDDKILQFLVCPATKQPLRNGTTAMVGKLNKRIKAGELTFVSGREVEEPLSGLLVTKDKQLGYGVFEDIPSLLIDEGIDLKKI